MRAHVHVLGSLAVLIVLTVPVAVVNVATAATFVVDSAADDGDAVPYDGVCATAGGACTLRAALVTAYEVAGPDVVMLPAGTYVLTSHGFLGVFDPVTIIGAGAATTIIDGDGADAVLHAQYAVLDVRDLTVRNGRTGILAEETPLTLTRVVVTENTGPLSGEAGGVSLRALNRPIACLVTDSTISNNAGSGILADQDYGSMTLTVRRSTITGNAGYQGGGIDAEGDLEVDETTIAGNTAFYGGGIYHWGYSPTLTLTRSTVEGNTATIDHGGVTTTATAGLVENTTISGNATNGYGGGLSTVFAATNLRVRNVTITANVADADDDGEGDAGGYSGRAEISNSIIAGNVDRSGETDDCAGSITSGGFNLIERYEHCTITGNLTGNVLGRPAGLAPLAMNGGPTTTHALLPGSQALDAGNPAAPGSGPTACAATDQRSTARPQGWACDVGAFEDTYVVTSCGNGTIDPGEQCDDGNVRAGDCCSPTCQLDAAGVVCFDADRCTDNACDGSGTCVATNNTAPCSDDSRCTTADTCSGGACVGGPPPNCDDGADCTSDYCIPSYGCAHTGNDSLCDDGDPCTLNVCHHSGPTNGCVYVPSSGASCDDGNVCTQTDRCVIGQCVGQDPVVCDDCLTCDPMNGCTTLAPDPACSMADQGGRSQLQLKDAADPTADSLKWSWSSPDGTPLDGFGTPTGPTTYDLCVYDESSGNPSLLLHASPAAGLCGAKPCWKTTGNNHLYKDHAGTADGLTSIKLTSVFPWAKIAIMAKGANLPPLGLPLAPDPTVVVQLRSSNGRCWGASFDAPRRNDSRQFKANTP